jgi:hypothetical protein
LSIACTNKGTYYWYDIDIISHIIPNFHSQVTLLT